MGHLLKNETKKAPILRIVTTPLLPKPKPVTPFEADKLRSGLTTHMLLDDSVYNLITSSTSRSISIDNIKGELDSMNI